MRHPFRVAVPAYDPLLADQHGVATRAQLAQSGRSASYVQAQIDGGRWQALNEHVVVTHNGPLTLEQRLWAVDLSAPGLHALCGLTALALRVPRSTPTIRRRWPRSAMAFCQSAAETALALVAADKSYLCGGGVGVIGARMSWRSLRIASTASSLCSLNAGRR